jgi:putative transposase
LVTELEKVFAAAGGPPTVLRMDNGARVGFPSAATVLRREVGIYYIPPSTPWNNGCIGSFNNRLRKECLNRTYWNTLLEARVVIGDFKRAQPSTPAFSAGLPNTVEYAAGCPHPGRLRD